MTTPVIDAEPVFTRNGERGTVRGADGDRGPRRYDGTDTPAGADEPTSPPGNGDLDRYELRKGEQTLARVLGW